MKLREWGMSQGCRFLGNELTEVLDDALISGTREGINGYKIQKMR